MRKVVFVSVFATILSFESFASTDFLHQPYNDIEWLNLLHYENKVSLIDKNSDFFLSEQGYKNPQLEYEKTLELLNDKSLSGAKSIQCSYPARTEFILKHEPTIILSKEKCTEYNEFYTSVPIDYIEIGFAAENNKSPISMMGHTFLILNGYTQNKVEKKHIFAYSANLQGVSTFDLIFDGLFLGLNGAYVLKPYTTYSSRYIQQEQRSIWKFRVDLTSQQIEKIKKHLWELKQHNIKYSLVFHNCNIATISLLKVADKNLEPNSYGLFLTPVEYIQQVSDEQKITDIHIEPTETTKKIINSYGLNYVLNANKPSKLSIGYKHSNKQDGISIKFSPVYQDTYDVTNAYFDILESKMLDVQFDYLFNNKVIFNDITIIKLSSITDTILTNTPTKHINLSLSNTPLNTHTGLYPVVEFGLGAGVHTKLFKAYITPTIGYQYRNQNIVYMTPEIGLVSQIYDKSRIVFKYNPFLNILGKQNKYDSITGYIGYKPFDNMEFYTEYKQYYNFNHNYTLKFGINKYF